MNINNFYQYIKEGIFTHIYELPPSKKINKIKILDAQILFDSVLAIKTDNHGIIYFKQKQLFSEKGISKFFIDPLKISMLSSINNHPRIEGIKKSLKYHIDSISELNAELEFLEKSNKYEFDILEEEKRVFKEKLKEISKNKNKKND